jgi:hypothetical protein
MMVKNNQFRDTIPYMQQLYANAKTINLNWVNNNRVPNPGTWFTTKSLSFGGVSRDLLPHLLSLYIALESRWPATVWKSKEIRQDWTLGELLNTDYGTVNPTGKYNVDDVVKLNTTIDGKEWNIHANWKSDTGDDIAIHFDDITLSLGLCPESAYKQMIITALNNISIQQFWNDQYKQDMWLHNNMEF